MARTAQSRNTSAPKYRLHKASGHAVVTINGKSIYLGKHNTDQSREQYNRLIVERSKSATGTAKPDAVVDLVAAEGVTITELAVDYAIESQNYYGKNAKPTSEWGKAQYVLRRLRALYGTMLAKDFGPKIFKAFRDVLVDEGCARTTINHYCFHIRRMFALAHENEVIPEYQYLRIWHIKPLQAGRSRARETDDVPPVADDIVDATSLLSGLDALDTSVDAARPIETTINADAWAKFIAAKRRELPLLESRVAELTKHYNDAKNEVDSIRDFWLREDLWSAN